MEIKILATEDGVKELFALAGNSKSMEYPCTTIPKALNQLISAEPYTGHDLVLGLIPVLVNCEISKPMRILLLFLYGKYMNISSQSLMHRDLANKPLSEIDSDFAYGFSFTTNLRLLKRMVADLQNWTNIQEVHDFVLTISLYLNDLGITDPQKTELSINFIKEEDYPDIENLCDPEDLCSPEGIESPIISHMGYYFEAKFLNYDLSMIEQLLRYTSGALFIRMDNPDRLFQNYKLTDKRVSVVGLFTEDQLKTIVKQRSNHKLKQWHGICDEIREMLE